MASEIGLVTETFEHTADHTGSCRLVHLMTNCRPVIEAWETETGEYVLLSTTHCRPGLADVGMLPPGVPVIIKATGFAP